MMGDMRFLAVGLKPFLQHLNDGHGIRANRDNVSIAMMFVDQLEYYQRWAQSTPDKTPQIHIGGLITPIFMARNIEMRGKRLELLRIDMHYLNKAKYLAGRLNASYAYKLRFSAASVANVLLPQEELTSLTNTRNVSFLLEKENLYDVRTHGVLQKITKAKRYLSRHQLEGPSGEAPSSPQPHPQSPTYGSSRYEFQPWDEPTLEPALQKAHDHIHLLQRFIKWQGRSFKKMVSQMKSLKGEVKSLKGEVLSLKKKFSGAGCSNPRPEEVADSMEVQGGENEELQHEEHAEERHSFHVHPSSQMNQSEPPRASSYERRQRKRRATRSPSLSGSSNPSYSMGSTSHSDTF